MAHKNVEQINTLLSLLDHPLIDIFLHLDFKSSIMQSDIISPSHSHLYFGKHPTPILAVWTISATFAPC